VCIEGLGLCFDESSEGKGREGMRRYTYLFQVGHRFLRRFLPIPWTVVGVVDNEVVGAQLVDDVRVGFGPVLVEVLLDDREVFGFFLGGHFCQRWMGYSIVGGICWILVLVQIDGVGLWVGFAFV
jgi:hypothetical protein